MPTDPIRRMLEVQQAQIARMDLAARRRLHARLEAARRDLRDRLDRVGGDTFTAQTWRVALLQVDTALRLLEQSFAEGLTEGAGDAYALANEHLVEQVRANSERFEGTVRPTNWAPAVAVDDEVLLDRFQVSARTYSDGLRQRIRGTLAQGLLEGASWSDLTQRLAGADGLLARDYFGMDSSASHRQSRAERVVRTEMAYAYNRAHHEDLRRAEADDPGYQKTLDATLDTRTGDDSVFVDGQVRELDEPFRDNEGRVYMHPPNRPNDREVELPTRPEWRGAAPVAEPSEAAAVEAPPEPAAEAPAVRQPEAVALAEARAETRRVKAELAEARRQLAEFERGEVERLRAELEDARQALAGIGGRGVATLSQATPLAGPGGLNQQSAKWARGLAQAERDAFFTWTDGDYSRMRALHRDGLPTNATARDRKLLDQVQTAQRASASAPRVTGPVYRGIRSPRLLDRSGNSIPLRTGSIFEVEAITATSVDSRIALEYSASGASADDRNIVMEIRSREARYIRGAANRKAKRLNEAVLPQGHRLRVVAVNHDVDFVVAGGTVRRTVVVLEDE